MPFSNRSSSVGYSSKPGTVTRRREETPRTGTTQHNGKQTRASEHLLDVQDDSEVVLSGKYEFNVCRLSPRSCFPSCDVLYIGLSR